MSIRHTALFVSTTVVLPSDTVKFTLSINKGQLFTLPVDSKVKMSLPITTISTYTVER